MSICTTLCWDTEEIFELTKLKGVTSRDSLMKQQYRPVCYLLESIYALAVSNTNNISSNPGFEWQLQYYGKATT